jgi:hypothetical protein
MNINEIKQMTEREGIVFLAYAGFLSQALISGMTDALEKETEYGGLGATESTHIFTIFIEMAQNMMNYSKNKAEGIPQFKPEGLILVGKDDEKGVYYVQSQNILDQEDKNKMEPKLIEIQSMDQEAIKKRYRELRKSGRDTHAKGGGIGFYEIAKRCSKVGYDFIPIQNNKYYFQFNAEVNTKKGAE